MSGAGVLGLYGGAISERYVGASDTMDAVSGSRSRSRGVYKGSGSVSGVSTVLRGCNNERTGPWIAAIAVLVR
jgi:hypothetical protein